MIDAKQPLPSMFVAFDNAALFSLPTRHLIMVTIPVAPSTFSLSPVLMILVAKPVPTTAGSPYSRQTIAAWEDIPPRSLTAALILANAGPQLGDVHGADQDVTRF